MGMRGRIGSALAALVVLAGAGPALAQVSAGASTSTAPAAGFVEQARAAVQRYADAGTFSGAVLVTRDGKPVFREAFGLGGRAPDVKASADTVYYIGSLTKQFTAAAVLQLADAGKLSVDDPVSKYYAKAPAAWSKITIKHLLSHRGGIPDWPKFLPLVSVEATKDHTPEQLIEVTRDMPLEFEPGTKYAYSNSGYAVLGYIIEKASGQSYADYVQGHIFTPLGMTHSGYGSNAKPPKGLAEGFDMSTGAPKDAAPISMTVPYAAGALYSTVDDMSVWDRALSADKVMSKASREQMETNQGAAYGFGVQVIAGPKGHPSIRHSGAMNGFEGCFYRFVQDGMTIVVLGNTRPGPVTQIAEELMWLYFGPPALPPPLVEVQVKSDVLARYAGVYELQPGVDVTLSVKDGRLYSQATGQPRFTLIAVSDREFRFPPANIKAEFPPGDGPAPGFTLTQGGAPREVKRKAN
ncbi:MAG TPA: serine hydrolase [Hyphomonadaceae bacterium]|jgi:CubicO group peptidase (beta-lactamase class C family)|nr:serine hydrolase [Hyphomonadaceae bacterium]